MATGLGMTTTMEINVTLRRIPLLLAAIAVQPLGAQADNEAVRKPAQVSATDYARAEALIGWNARELVVDDAVNPKWMSAHAFWYRNHSAKGYEFLVVDAATGAKRPLSRCGAPPVVIVASLPFSGSRSLAF